ncbi:hypothetical protein PDE_05160 [Penicillium oxalicum 114-2]|uniref:Gfd2/YDR514C-like C-terminal domain-containing protein n=1 Tax=Penicillium oxalicum (strain 114-2 / CGMCC 5302) TaxID=933388 RepID=S7ZHR8_PENO1|nr:hypothetical protein PDE_05160 [Penicillium oxalicum 114-2]
MNRAQRLQLLFAGDEDLLQLDTHLARPTNSDNLKADFTEKAGEDTLKDIEPVDGGPLPHLQPQTLMANLPPSASKIPEWELRRAYVPAKALPKFPYKYVFPYGRELSRKVARAYFDGGRVWQRVWEIYHLPLPGEKYLLLVPALQVKQLLDEINHDFDCDLALLTSQKGLVLSFNDDDGTPQPVRLGLIEDREGLYQMEQQIRQATKSQSDWMKTCSPAGLRAFQKKAYDALMTFKRGSSKSKGQSGGFDAVFASSGELTRTLRKIQSYLGLQQLPPQKPSPPESADTSACAPLEVNREENDVTPVFYSIDVEWNERNSHQITEIGISILDTRDLRSLSPGPHGDNWAQLIRSVHLRVAEYKSFCNTRFVRGCPHLFLFGKSEFVPERRIGRRVDDFFAPPSGDAERHIGASPPAQKAQKEPARKMILVGHSPDGDVNLLAQRSRVFQTFLSEGSIFLETLDTQQLYRHLRKEPHQRSLEHVLHSLGIEPRCLHNAGNDARYTMEALIRIAWDFAE